MGAFKSAFDEARPGGSGIEHLDPPAAHVGRGEVPAIRREGDQPRRDIERDLVHHSKISAPVAGGLGGGQQAIDRVVIRWLAACGSTVSAIKARTLMLKATSRRLRLSVRETRSLPIAPACAGPAPTKDIPSTVPIDLDRNARRVSTPYGGNAVSCIITSASDVQARLENASHGLKLDTVMKGGHL